jgi:hypothetical protein
LPDRPTGVVKERHVNTLRRSLALSLGASALFVLVYYWFAMISGRLAMIFRDAALLGPAMTVAQWATLLATACLVGAGGLVALKVALRPGSWPRPTSGACIWSGQRRSDAPDR